MSGYRRGAPSPTTVRICRWLGVLASAGLATGTGAAAGPAPAEIVVAMRYLQATGRSHAHLYLYRAGDGKLLRQLTGDDCGQDSEPVFAPDGSSIVFTRAPDAGGPAQCWRIEPQGKGLRQIAAPDWYAQTKSSPHFAQIFHWGTSLPPVPGSDESDSRWLVTSDRQTDAQIVPSPLVVDLTAPDAWDVYLRSGQVNATDPPTNPSAKAADKVGEIDGFSADFLAGPDPRPDFSILREGALAVAFCSVHLNSTDGGSVYALDLHARRLVQLSPNWADPVPLPGEPAFLTLTENRYLRYGDGDHTANCSYVARWDAALKEVRYARDQAPGICEGASMYRPGRTPATVTIRSTGD